jgi:hypothetical protein
MSSLGKIFLYIAAAGALVALVIGYLLITDFAANRQTLATTQRNLDTTQKEETKAKADLVAANKDNADTHASLTEATTKITDLNSQLADATKRAGDASAAVAAAQDATKKDQDQLDAITAALKGQKPEDVMAQVDKLTAQVAADNTEQKILEDQLQAANKDVSDLKLAVNRAGQKPALMPPGISGKVTFVNTSWSFVVLNVGLSNGVVPNGELIIYRGRDFIGKVKVTSAEDNTAVADILPGAKGDIQAGDDVLN